MPRSISVLSLHLSTWVNRFTHCWDMKFLFNSHFLFMTTLPYTLLNGDAHHAVFKLLRNRTITQRNTGSSVRGKIQSVIRQWKVLYSFVHVLQPVQNVVKVKISSNRIGYGRVRSCPTDHFGSRCFYSIIWCLFLHPIPFILCCCVHIIWEGSNRTEWLLCRSYRLVH